jgi:AraC family transcriptional regulator
MNVTEIKHKSLVVFKRKASWQEVSLEHYRCRAGELPEHCHQQHMVLVSLTDGSYGEMRTASGFRFHGNQTSGSVCVLPAGMPHKARLEGDAEHLALYLNPSVVRRAASESGLSDSFEVVERCSDRDPVISSIGKALLGELDSEGLSGRLYADSLANVLAVHLLRHYTASAGIPRRSKGGLSGHKLQQVQAFISENYSSDLRLDELAQVAQMSSFHFAREFKRTTGTTPHQYLIKFRIEHAKGLLAESEIPLVEVGFRSGFSHQSHFTRLFHKLTGTTPHSYRLMLQT